MFRTWRLRRTYLFYIRITNFVFGPHIWVIVESLSLQVGVRPWVCVWDTKTCTQLQRLHHPYGTRGIIALGFSPDGDKLTCCGSDNAHTLFVWSWLSKPKEPQPCPGWGYGPDKKFGELKITQTEGCAR